MVNSDLFQVLERNGSLEQTSGKGNTKKPLVLVEDKLVLPGTFLRDLLEAEDSSKDRPSGVEVVTSPETCQRRYVINVADRGIGPDRVAMALSWWCLLVLVCLTEQSATRMSIMSTITISITLERRRETSERVSE